MENKELRITKFETDHSKIQLLFEFGEFLEIHQRIKFSIPISLPTTMLILTKQEFSILRNYLNDLKAENPDWFEEPDFERDEEVQTLSLERVTGEE